jgi:hypothetical protein
LLVISTESFIYLFNNLFVFKLLPFATYFTSECQIEILLFVTEPLPRTPCTLVLAVNVYLNHVVSHLPWPTLFVILKTSVLHLIKLSPPLENRNVDVKVDLSLTRLNKLLFNDILLSRGLVERRSRFQPGCGTDEQNVIQTRHAIYGTCNVTVGRVPLTIVVVENH